MSENGTIVTVTTASMSEEEWTSWVIDLARWNQWKVAHFRPSRTVRGWSTSMQGDTGFPDVVFARDGVVFLRELKTDHGRVRPEQRAWLDHMGDMGGVWRPSDKDEVIATLTQSRKGAVADAVELHAQIKRAAR